MKTQNCNCGKNHKTLTARHNCIAKQIGRNQEKRGTYDEILGYGSVSSSPDGKYSASYGKSYVVNANTIVALFRDCLTEEYCEFDKKGRGSALNHDLYGYDPKQGVAVIQARQCIGTKYGKSSHKTYFLCGHNEITGSAFVHPVGSHAIRAAINAGGNAVEVVKAAQRWMWEITQAQLSKSVRQGDLLIVPEKAPSGEYRGEVMVLAGSHEVQADEIRENGRVYALNPRLIHTKGQHHPVAVQGWASIRIAREASAWDFAQRRGD